MSDDALIGETCNIFLVITWECTLFYIRIKILTWLKQVKISLIFWYCFDYCKKNVSVIGPSSSSSSNSNSSSSKNWVV